MDRMFNQFISSKRVEKSSVNRKVPINEFYSDRSRVLYSSSFRRLQQKAQVFSLEPNASVRTRLTHSLEVSDIGRTLANSIAYELRRKKLLSDGNVPIVVSIVENACLLHDIGNPPFGHFGEAAIKDWAKEYVKKYIENHKNENQEAFKQLEKFKQLMEDFAQFDGNPQGFRTVTKLHTERDENGLNLTYSTLLCILKYSRAAGETIDSSEIVSEDIIKKAGYFQSEKELVERIYKECGLSIHHRYPFTYIMEAADDIAYCMSDIADGIEKGILTEKSFIEAFVAEWQKENRDDNGKPLPLPKIISTIRLKNGKKVKLTEKIDSDQLCGFNIDISIPWSKAASSEAINCFMDNIDKIRLGTAQSLISKDGELGKVLETIKSVSKKLLYTSIKAESIELTGFSVITGILKRYERLLELPAKEFEKIANHQSVNGMDYERRLFNRLGSRYVKAYQYAARKLDKTTDCYDIFELWLRIHLIIDHISGMTDEFALETYQMLEGIQLLKS